jgi:hypothetical protein
MQNSFETGQVNCPRHSAQKQLGSINAAFVIKSIGEPLCAVSVLLYLQLIP